jgi:hypothetical protein
MSTNSDAAGPRLTSVLIIGLLTFALGKLLAIASLVSQPVTVLTKEPDPESVTPGIVYHVRGDRSGRTVWRAKEEAWREGTVSVLSLSEAELNQWSRERLKLSSAAPAAEGSSWRDKLKVNASPVNFKIVGDQLQLATEVDLGETFKDRTFMYQVTGHFSSTSRGVRFVRDKASLGQAPVGAFPFYGDVVYSLVSDRFTEGPEGEWLAESFAGLESVEIADGQLILRRRAEG